MTSALLPHSIYNAPLQPSSVETFLGAQPSARLCAILSQALCHLSSARLVLSSARLVRPIFSQALAVAMPQCYRWHCQWQRSRCCLGPHVSAHSLRLRSQLHHICCQVARRGNFEYEIVKFDDPPEVRKSDLSFCLEHVLVVQP